MAWQAPDAERLKQLLSFVSSSIGARTAFDELCRSVAQTFAASRGLELEEKGRRMLQLRRKRVRYLLEWGRGVPTLERLHRLHRDRRALNCGRGLLVCGDRPIDPLTHEAVAWAGSGRLRVSDSGELYSALETSFR